MACGHSELFPPFFLTFSDRCVLLCTGLKPSPIFLERFEQFSLSSHSSSSCKNKNCNFHTLLYDRSNSIFSPEKFDLIEFRYQTVDCLFTAYHYYFRNVLKQSGQLFQKLTEASEFHRSLPFIALKRPSVAKKRLLRKRFKFYQKQSRYLLSWNTSNHLTGSTEVIPISFLCDLSKILQSELGSEFLQLFCSISKGQRTFQSNHLSFTIKK